MRILVNIPDLDKPGGVAALFKILKLEQHNPNVYMFRLHNKIWTVFRIPIKYMEFIFKLINTDIVHLNPSLNKKSFLRDAVFAWLALLFSKKVIIYWHGWDVDYETIINKNKILKYVFQHSFLRATRTIVLGTLFEEKLRKLGYKNEIVIETNCAENKYIGTQKPKNISVIKPIQLLFISRLETAKGIYIAIETIRILNRERNKFKLVIAGTGSEEFKIKELIKGDESIEWAGYVNEEAKHKLLEASHLMFFPSSHPEGMPLTLLEGMMYGLPIVSRPVGGIPDIVTNGENGFLLMSIEPKDYADKITQIINDPDLYIEMSQNNINKSKLFTPGNVRDRLFSLYKYVYGE